MKLTNFLLFAALGLISGAVFVAIATQEGEVLAGVSERVASTTEGLVEKVTKESKEETQAEEKKRQRVEHVEIPDAVKAVYMSQCAGSSSKLRKHILDLVDQTELNAVVLDLKDYTGTVSFPSETAISTGEGCRIADFRELIKEMHARDIYVIGRLTVFQDPLYTATYPEYAVRKLSSTTQTWQDYKGLSFVDVGSKPFWDYIIALSREAYDLGVDEINFDYIRYPSDGNMADVHYANSSGDHADNLERFFEYLAKELRGDEYTPVMSADLFGMTTTNVDDLSIGQVLERALPYFDYIAPMVYPSHYPPGFNGYANPNDKVYDVIKFSMDSAVPRVEGGTTDVFAFAHEPLGTSTGLYLKETYPRTVLRPWLQDFDYGGNYGVIEVRQQIQAAYDAGLTSWMLWDPANIYTRGALKSAGDEE